MQRHCGRNLGGALTERLVADGARVVVSDRIEAAETSVVAQIDRNSRAEIGVAADVSESEDIRSLIKAAESISGPVELNFANAGTIDAPDLQFVEQDWELSIAVNLLAHVRTARFLVTKRLGRGGRCSSAPHPQAGLTKVGSATYATTKHAAIGVSEWLSMTNIDQSLRMNCLHPMGIKTRSFTRTGSARWAPNLCRPPARGPHRKLVADSAIHAMKEDLFAILLHPEALGMYRNKGAGYDRRLRGVRRFQASLLPAESSQREVGKPC